MAFTHDTLETILLGSDFRSPAIRAVVKLLSDGQWHSKTEIEEKTGVRLNNINRIVNKLRDDFGANVIRGNLPPEEGRWGGDGVKWAIIFDEAPPGPAIKNVVADDECVEFTKSGKRYMLRSTEGGLYITGPGVALLV